MSTTYFCMDIYSHACAYPPKVSLAHHVACCLVYLLTLRPFLHHIGNLFLLFQASTLLIDIASWSQVVVTLPAYSHTCAHACVPSQPCTHILSKGFSPRVKSVLRRAHVIVFVAVRIGIGLPLSFEWVNDMINHVQSGTTHSLVTHIRTRTHIHRSTVRIHAHLKRSTPSRVHYRSWPQQRQC